MENPLRLAIVEDGLGPDSSYAAVFVTGGHGATISLLKDPAVGRALQWALESDRYVVSLCHGPAALLAAKDDSGANLFAGFEVAVFPDALDAGLNKENGYMPGAMRWLVAARLAKAGLTVSDNDMTGLVHRDRTLITGDSPLASNALGWLAVGALTGVEDYADR